MANRYQTLVVVTGALLLLIGCVNSGPNKYRPECDQIPIRRITISFDPAHRDTLFDHIRSFADFQGFAVRIAGVYAGSRGYVIELWREDLKIIGANPFSDGEFRLGVFDNSCFGPPPEIPVTNLIDDFRLKMQEIDGVTVSEK